MNIQHQGGSSVIYVALKLKNTEALDLSQRDSKLMQLFRLMHFQLVDSIHEVIGWEIIS